jgi:hypothetical protein
LGTPLCKLGARFVHRHSCAWIDHRIGLAVARGPRFETTCRNGRVAAIGKANGAKDDEMGLDGAASSAGWATHARDEDRCNKSLAAVDIAEFAIKLCPLPPLGRGDSGTAVVEDAACGAARPGVGAKKKYEVQPPRAASWSRRGQATLVARHLLYRCEDVPEVGRLVQEESCPDDTGRSVPQGDALDCRADDRVVIVGFCTMIATDVCEGRARRSSRERQGTRR